jgi:phospholipid transport system substrate-binding protein
MASLARRVSVIVMGSLVGISLTTSLPAQSAEKAGPSKTVNDLHAGLLSVMKNAKKLGFNGRVIKLRPVVSKAYDLTYLARRCLGREWKKLSKAEQKTYASAFAAWSIASHASRFSGFAGEKFEITGVKKPGRGYILVETRIVRVKDKPVQIHYLTQKRKKGWKVIDVFLNGTISEVAKCRSEFRAILRDKGSKGLIIALNQKTKSARTGKK